MAILWLLPLNVSAATGKSFRRKPSFYEHDQFVILAAVEITKSLCGKRGNKIEQMITLRYLAQILFIYKTGLGRLNSTEVAFALLIQ